jgi:hypothetical protein
MVHGEPVVSLTAREVVRSRRGTRYLRRMVLVRVVCVLCVLLTSCSRERWITTSPEMLRAGGEAMLMTEDRAIHATVIRRSGDRVQGRVWHPQVVEPVGASACHA